ncbi:MAG: nucleotidyltransferase domain-containing protein, partial [Desulfobacterales bacterium]
VDRAMRLWTAEQVRMRPEIVRLGYFGSYARGDWGVGSDLDVISIVRKTAEPFERRSLEWDLISLPVPAEIIVYSLPEWEKLEQGNTLFFRMLDRDVVWTFSI